MNAIGSQTIADLSPDGIVYLNTDNKVEYANPAFMEMTGFSSEQIIGIDKEELARRILSLCDSKKQAPCNIGAITRTEIMCWRDPFSKLISCTPKFIDDEQGNAVRVLFFHDFSREKETDRQIKNEFLAVAAHKLRTPLVGILGFSELLLKKNFAVDQQKEVIGTIYRQATNFKNLLDDFLDIERLDVRSDDDFRYEITALEHVFDEVIKEQRELADDITIMIEKPDSWPQVKCDVERVRQVFSNLMSNAIKYSFDGGTVTCKTALRSKDGAEEFGLVVVDQGIGMSPEELERIGERFYRADNTHAEFGSGLGIALVREIIAIHQGHFEIESSKGKGTTATCWLPLSAYFV